MDVGQVGAAAMVQITLPRAVSEALSSSTDATTVFQHLLPALGHYLQCDRCFLYLRDPQTRYGQAAFCWCRSDAYPDVSEAEWKQEPESLAAEDPQFAAALRTAPSLFIEDVETADPVVVNQEFERTHFGHRALIHGHICQGDQLWGILQPCVFGQPRPWTSTERSMIEALLPQLVPLAIAYVMANRPTDS